MVKHVKAALAVAPVASIGAVIAVSMLVTGTYIVPSKPIFWGGFAIGIVCFLVLGYFQTDIEKRVHDET